jgi:flagellar hook assembly protein FlgD
MSYRISLKAFMIAALLMFLGTEPLAKGIRKRVKFPRGFSGVTLKGNVIRGDRDEYLLKAGKGQTMKVKITSEENNAVFQIYAANGKALKGADEGDDAMEWNGKLPLSGDYRIVVGGTRGNASYSISVEIE